MPRTVSLPTSSGAFRPTRSIVAGLRKICGKREEIEEFWEFLIFFFVTLKFPSEFSSFHRNSFLSIGILFFPSEFSSFFSEFSSFYRNSLPFIGVPPFSSEFLPFHRNSFLFIGIPLLSIGIFSVPLRFLHFAVEFSAPPRKSLKNGFTRLSRAHSP